MLLAAFPFELRRDAFRADPEAGLTALFASLDGAPDPREGERASPLIGRPEMRTVSRQPAAVGVRCGWALQSAEWLADCVAEAVAREAELDPGLRATRSPTGARSAATSR